MKFRIALLCLFSALVIVACSKDDDEDNGMTIEECEETPTYNDDIQPIMEEKCATPACHGGGESPGDFRDLSVLQQYIDAGLIEERVLIQRNMPPAGMQLTSEELQAFQCWVEGGYPIE